jgi:putative redox protein
MSADKPTNLWKEIRTNWDGADGYFAKNEAGATVLMGKDKAGNPGIGPMEMLLSGLAGCTGMDIVDILKKKRQVPTDFKVVVRGNQKIDVYPMVFVEFQVEYLFWGENLVPKDVEQAIRLSEEKYCSVGGTLVKAAPIHSTYRILKPGEQAE